MLMKEEAEAVWSSLMMELGFWDIVCARRSSQPILRVWMMRNPSSKSKKKRNRGAKKKKKKKKLAERWNDEYSNSITIMRSCLCSGTSDAVGDIIFIADICP